MRAPVPSRGSSGAGAPKALMALGAVVLVALAAAAFLFLGGKGESKGKPAPKVNIVPVLPPPPPPPTPPPTPPPAPPEPVEPPPDAPEFVEEKAPEAAPEPEAPDEPAPMGSNIQGDGPPDGFGLTGRGGGGLIGGSGKKGGGGGTRFGWYAGRVQGAVTSALRTHRATRSARLTVKARIWVDPTGRVTRASIDGSTGDPEIDQALQQEILLAIRLSDPPPEGMPMPIVMRINASRP